jgi:isoleucyl-tRNA synthetase
VLTHGFIVAEDGRKMSKSLGNSIDPQQVISQSGADILRLWVSMSDYTQEIRLSQEILSRAVEAYRKIRNTLRYLVANLYDFDPARDMVERSRLEEVDRYILARYAELGRRVLDAYDSYDYGTIFQAVNAFATVDLSAFYADVSKDRLYTFRPRSTERRSAQTAMYVIADGLARLMAPILSFTSDELWRYLPGARDESVHLAIFPERTELDGALDSDLVARWDRLIALRERVLAEIEPLRKNKQIGSSLQARVVLTGGSSELAWLEPAAQVLPMLFIVSDVELRPSAGDGAGAAIGITIERATGVKCERCWRYVPSVSTAADSAGLCDRCVDALELGQVGARAD